MLLRAMSLHCKFKKSKYENLVFITVWVQKSYLTSSSFRFSIDWLGWGSITVKIHVQITVIRYSYRVETVGQVY